MKNETILALSSRNGWQPAILLNTAGEQEELSCFERDDTTQAEFSCTVNWKNQLFIFGGRSEKRQISRLTGHRLKRVGNLTFDFYDGACDVMANQYLFLCFGDDSKDYKQCRRSTGPLEHFSKIELSNRNHLRIQISCSDSK